MKKFVLLLFSISSLLTFSCEIENNDLNFEVTRISKSEHWSSPYIVITVRNSGNLEGSCNAEIKLKKGNTIVDRSFDIFSNLHPNEQEERKITFFKIDKHSEYSEIVIELEWQSDSSSTQTRTFFF